MILAGDFRKGVTVEIDGQVWSIADFQHVKPGKGAAFVRTRLKNVMTGAVLEKTFSPTDKYPLAHIETREMQYLYNDGDLYYFMDPENYEQIMINKDIIGDAMKFVKENDTVKVCSYNG
ncbi:MAG: elongation factor P, partial [Clostridia bacterium]|nr:elongation factor P [Clostridia bacterium]